MITARVIGLPIGYLAGLFQTGVIVSRSRHADLRHTGSGNTGMTNSIRVMGWKAGILVVIGDVAKTLAAIIVVWLIYRHTFPEAVKLLMLYAGLGAVLGHNFPFYLKFKGGKGIACTVGVVFGFQALMVPICAIIFFTAVIPTGLMSLGSLAMSAAFFVQTVVFGQVGLLPIAARYLPETYVVAAIITGLAYLQHRENIVRLAHGEERKFAPGANKKKENNDGN